MKNLIKTGGVYHLGIHMDFLGAVKELREFLSFTPGIPRNAFRNAHIPYSIQSILDDISRTHLPQKRRFALFCFMFVNGVNPQMGLEILKKAPANFRYNLGDLKQWEYWNKRAESGVTSWTAYDMELGRSVNLRGAVLSRYAKRRRGVVPIVSRLGRRQYRPVVNLPRRVTYETLDVDALNRRRGRGLDPIVVGRPREAVRTYFGPAPAPAPQRPVQMDIAPVPDEPVSHVEAFDDVVLDDDEDVDEKVFEPETAIVPVDAVIRDDAVVEYVPPPPVEIVPPGPEEIMYESVEPVVLEPDAPVQLVRHRRDARPRVRDWANHFFNYLVERNRQRDLEIRRRRARRMLGYADPGTEIIPAPRGYDLVVGPRARLEEEKDDDEPIMINIAGDRPQGVIEYVRPGDEDLNEYAVVPVSGQVV